MNIREFLDVIDNPFVIIIYAVIAVLVTAHMNRMYKGTPKLEVAGWWCLGVGSFAVMMYEIYDSHSEWGHVLFGIGALILVLLNTQPDWRGFFANRRKERDPKMPDICDRRRDRNDEATPQT